MKKLVSFALCLVIALAFAAGCKKKEAPVEQAPAQAPMTSAQAAPAAPAAPAK